MPSNGEGSLPGRIRGTISTSGTGGDKVSYKFRGTGVEVLGVTGDDHGIADLSLDGKPVGRIDTFVPVDILMPKALLAVPTICLWGTHELQEGEHTLELTVTGEKNPKSTGTLVGIDAIVVLNGSAGESPRQ